MSGPSEVRALTSAELLSMDWVRGMMRVATIEIDRWNWIAYLRRHLRAKRCC